MKTIQVFNFGTVIDGVKALRIRKDSEYNEYRVEYILENGKAWEGTAYFTTDKQDAIDTAQFEFNRYLEMGDAV
jgi:hypothetical protein